MATQNAPNGGKKWVLYVYRKVCGVEKERKRGKERSPEGKECGMREAREVTDIPEKFSQGVSLSESLFKKD